jgi:hypothetical protein
MHFAACVEDEIVAIAEQNNWAISGVWDAC